MDVGFHYLSKVENQKLDFGDYPSDGLICQLAVELDVDVVELLLRAKKVPDGMRNRIFERPEVFSAANVSDERRIELDRRGMERALIYKTAILTGLRHNELQTLKVGGGLYCPRTRFATFLWDSPLTGWRRAQGGSGGNAT